jgi:cytidylate kinase
MSFIKHGFRKKKHYYNAFFEDTFEESINDRNIFKVVWMSGGPGSGKSFIANSLSRSLGMPIVSSDVIFELMLSKRGLSKKLDKTKPEQFQKQMTTRSEAKILNEKDMLHIINGMLPFIIDGTGKDYNKIEKQRTSMMNIGYDTMMVLVNTNLEAAQRRNAKRSRSLPEDAVEEMWNLVQNNIGKFQELFGQNFVVVDNSEDIEGEEARKKKTSVLKVVRKFVESPLQNIKGKQIVQKLEQSGGLYLSDLPNEL